MYISFFFELIEGMRLIVVIVYKLAIEFGSKKNSNWERKTPTSDCTNMFHHVLEIFYLK